jgi:hypothetical protein
MIFTPREFAAFTNEVVECFFYVETQPAVSETSLLWPPFGD